MSDTARPHDQVADEPDSAGVPDPDGSMHDVVEPPPVDQDAPASRIELEEDPFAAPAPWSEMPLDPVAVLEVAPEVDAVEEAEGTAPEESDVTTSEAGGEDAAPSLDDMVSELADDETPPDAAPDGVESGSEAETTEGEGVVEAAEAEEGEPEPEPTSWRDEAAAAAVVPTLVRQRLSTRLPFWLYGGVWVVFAGVMTYFMWPLSVDPFVGTQYYSYFVLGCAALLALGPFLGLAAWLWGRMGTTSVERGGLVRAVSLRAATWMAVGVALMWICLYVLDLHRTGVIG